jgi:hypothetical protein
MSKQVLSIEQMQHLKELGVDTSKASAYWHNVIKFEKKKYVNEWILSLSDSVTLSTKKIPTFTLQDILDLLPTEIEKENRNYQLEVFRNPQRYFVSYYWLDNLLISLNEVEFIDAAYEMLCWVIKNGYLETKE